MSCEVTAQLICFFVFAHAKSRFSHDAAQIKIKHKWLTSIHAISLTVRQNLTEFNPSKLIPRRFCKYLTEFLDDLTMHSLKK